MQKRILIIIISVLSALFLLLSSCGTAGNGGPDDVSVSTEATSDNGGAGKVTTYGNETTGSPETTGVPETAATDETAAAISDSADTEQSPAGFDGEPVALDTTEGTSAAVTEPAVTEVKERTLIVACVGDSTTYGVGASNASSTSYPAVLQQLLGDGFKVYNLGKSRAYVINNEEIEYIYASESSNAYTLSQEYKTSLKIKPDIVIIMLGTNDAYTASSNKQVKAKLLQAYGSLIDSYKSLDSKPEIFLILPPDRFDSEARRVAAVRYVQPAIREIAEAKGCYLIDVYSVTKPYVDDAALRGALESGGYFSDGVHPGDKGYKLIADTVYEALTK